MFKEKFHNDIDKCSPCCDEDGCNVNAFQEMDICVPITIEPYVNLSETIVECIDDPYISPAPYCKCNKNGTCKFTIAQRLCVMVPIEFKASASSGPTSVICGEISDEDCPSYICDENSKYEPQPPYKFYIKGKPVQE